MMPRHFNTKRMEQLVTHSLEETPTAQEGDQYHKPTGYVYEEDFRPLLNSHVYKPIKDYSIMEPAALQDYFGMVFSILEKDTGFLSRRKMKMDVFHSILKYLKSNFPLETELYGLAERYYIRQTIEVGAWEKVLAENVRFFMDLKLAIDIQAFKTTSKAMERDISQARPKQKDMLRKKLQEYVSTTPEEIPKNALKKFQEMIKMIMEAPEAASLIPHAGILLKRELTESSMSDHLKTELFLRVLVPAVEAVKTEAFSVIPSLFD
jgi:hypothetical protein